jgi:hypothetical protein
MVPRRRLRTVLPLAAAVALFLAAAAPAVDRTGVTLVSSTLPTLTPGETAWVTTLWRGADADAGSFQLTASAPAGTTVSYPTNTGAFSSLSKQATLLAGDTDYAALKIRVGDAASGSQRIDLTVSYVPGSRSGGYGSGSGGYGSGGYGRTTEQLQVTLPVVAATGDAVRLLTTSVGPVKAGTAQFVQVSLQGVKPGVTNVAVKVTDPGGATVSYPGDRSSTSLSQDGTLDVGETDTAAFRVDAAKLTPGSYRLGIDIAFGSGQRLPGALTLVVS